MPAVSVIMNCLNEGPYLREALDSVVAQTYDDWEVVFWDNASTDGSFDIAATYGEKVRCFRSESQIILGLVRSKAFEQCRGEYIALLDGDDVWMPEKLERQMALFESNPESGLVFCDAIYFDDGGDRHTLFKLTPPRRGHVFGELLSANFMFSSSMVFRKDALDKIGYAFDDRYRRVMDWDLSLRMAFHFPIDYVDEPLCKWRMNEWEEKDWKKNLVPRAVEMATAMDNLVDMYPAIKEQYSQELDSFYRVLDYQAGITAWHDKKPSQARQRFSRHLTSKKYAMAYFLTYFLPYSWFNTARKFYRNNITSRF